MYVCMYVFTRWWIGPYLDMYFLGMYRSGCVEGRGCGDEGFWPYELHVALVSVYVAVPFPLLLYALRREKEGLLLLPLSCIRGTCHS